ncbi:MAG: glycoside hydrolase family 57 [Rhizomicrobium sp.]|jgi:hypothetical protein
MNAPFPLFDARASCATLRLFALFHLNLAFSSIEEGQRGDVIQRCYWPLLDLAQSHGPIGLEITGFTLEEIAARDPEWCGRARALIAKGRIELIGSGYAQIIGPLVPAEVTQANLRIGNDFYKRLLGHRPALALVNEQAYSAGLVGLYLDAGYQALLMDWDNPAAHHPEWPAETRYLPQRALGSDGRSIALLWTSTVAFQKLQRFVHGDMPIGDYLDYVESRRGAHARALCLYASDAEIFDFRPGRYKTEEAIGCTSEWRRFAEALAAVETMPGCALVAPSDALALASVEGANLSLRLESASCPVPVKKQRKYSLARWAVTGRDDVAVNAACQRIYRGLVGRSADDVAWKELCYLWSSDFRTHITERRWTAFCERLARAEREWGGVRIEPCHRPVTAEAVSARHIDVVTPALSATLDRRRGLAIERLTFAGDSGAVIGGLPHGHFDDIALQADWYTGDCVFEAPGEHKVTDLEWCEAHVWRSPEGDQFASARVETSKGAIEKTMCFRAGEPRVDFDVTFDWSDWNKGSLRLGHVTLLPDAFDWEKLSLTTHNGGKECETFSLKDTIVDHGAPVSFLVSSSHGLGLTEGWATLGDGETAIRVDVDRATAPLLGFLIHKKIGGSLFCQFVLSALELDETRKPSPYRAGPRRFRFGISRVRRAGNN